MRTAIGTVGDLADYYRIPNADARQAVLELVEAGACCRSRCRAGVSRLPAPPDAKMPRKVGGRALLCPFDPLVWERGRTERLFDFRYRIEIYTPAEKRVYGYYVFPFLMDDTLVARFDLKADRASGRLLVQASWCEPGGAGRWRVAEAAAAVELRRMADWLGLAEVVVVPRGDLACRLAAEYRGDVRLPLSAHRPAPPADVTAAPAGNLCGDDIPAGVAAGHPATAAAGLAVLAAGGSAADSAVAMILAGCVAETIFCGLGGGGFATYYERRHGTVTASTSSSAYRVWTAPCRTHRGTSR